MNKIFIIIAKKIRWLMKRFPCERIMMDSQGGGIAVMEALHDSSKIDASKNERPIWEVVVPDEPKDSDLYSGDHLVELVSFADYEWTSSANHWMRKDLEDKALLFPYLDPLIMALVENLEQCRNDKVVIQPHLYDTLDDCVLEIEELKEELATIVITKTPTGRDRWDTPEVKLPGGKKGRLRKDRYTALLMANMGARNLLRNPNVPIILAPGGFAGPRRKESGKMYEENDWYDQWARSFYQ